MFHIKDGPYMGVTYKIGEFAKICGTAKSTLIYYNKIGLMHPDYIGENGYFYYSASQIYIYEAISSLRSMDVSLEDIKDYLNNQDVSHCLAILKKNVEHLRNQRLKLERIENLMQSTIVETEKALQIECDKFEFVTLEEEHYFIYGMPYRTEKAAYNLQDARKLIDYCKHNYYNGTLAVSEIVLQEHINDRTFKKTYGAFRLRNWQEDEVKMADKENLFVRPHGTYATVAMRRGGDQIPSIYRALCKFIKENGYRVCGNGYEEDLLSYMMEHDRTNYLVRCYIQVEIDDL